MINRVLVNIALLPRWNNSEMCSSMSPRFPHWDWAIIASVSCMLKYLVLTSFPSQSHFLIPQQCFHFTKQPPKHKKPPNQKKLKKKDYLQLNSCLRSASGGTQTKPLNVELYIECLRRAHDVWNSCNWSWIKKKNSFRNQTSSSLWQIFFPHKALTVWTKDVEVFPLEDHH